MSKPCFRNKLVLAALCIALTATPGFARTDKNAREPLVVTAASMEAEELGTAVTFTGNVTLKKEGMTLSSDTMVILYDAGSKNIREIEAQGNVVVHKDGRVALSNHASYFSREEKIVLTGDARIIENENQLGGQKITLFMRDDRSIVEGGKVLFYEDRQPKADDIKKSK